MNFITSLFSLGAKGVGQGFKHPMIGGGIIGGAAGFLGSDANTFTQRLQDTGRGIAVGATMGAMMPFSGAGIYGKLLGQRGNVWGATKNIGVSALKAGRFALEHPVGLAAAGLGAYGVTQMLGAYGQSGISPSMQGAAVKTDWNQQAMQAEDISSIFVNPPGVIGSSSQYRQQMSKLHNSTHGLVQGLHAGRHG